MKRSLTLITSLVLLLLGQNNFAQTLYWDGGTANISGNGDGISEGGAGTWSGSIQNWDQGSGLPHVAWTSGDNAFFGGTAGLVTLSGALTANWVAITNKGYNFTDGGNSANTLTVSTITNSTGGGQTTPTIFTNNIINSATLTISGSSSSDLRLDAANSSLTGTIVLNQGLLEIGDGTTYNGGFSGGWSASLASNTTLIIRNEASGSGTPVGNTISGQGSVEIENKSGVTTLLGVPSGNSTYTGSTIIASGILVVESMDDVNPNPLGTGPLQIGENASSATFNYQGSTAFTTTRPLVLGGNGTSIITGVNGEAITFAGPFIYGPNITAASKTLELTGAGYTDQGYNTLACNLTNFGAIPLIVNKQSGSFVLTGSNSFTGGVTFTGANSGVLYITNDNGLGAPTGGIFLTNGSGAISSLGANVTIGASRTVLVNTNVAFTPGDSNNLTVSAYITGNGYASKGSISYTLGVVRFNNDTNNFTGNFSMGYGTMEFTSVAEAGLPSSLGAGSFITNNNSTSFGVLRYVGTNNCSTHRPLVWAATTGALGLDNTNTGTIAYLSSAALATGAGSKTLDLEGSNTGSNTLAQVINDNGGTTSVSKSGSGEWILTGANTYSGSTTISDGTLLINGSLGSGAVNVYGGTLGGTGTIGGAVTMTNGTLMAGSPGSASLATLTINNSLTSGETGAISVKLNKTLAGSDKFTGISTLTYGGTLLLTNLSGSLTTNDSFQIFSATSYQGAFSAISPATPGPGLAWNTNNLVVNGTLGIAAAAPVSLPSITSFSFNGTTLTIQGTNGTANGPFVLLSSTNAALPVSQWKALLTNSFDAGGNFNLTTNLGTTSSQQYFIISE